MAETQAKVVFDYNPDGPNQLELRKGQNIIVLGSPNTDGWVEAKKGAQVGWIPAGYYEVIKTSAGQSRPPPPGPDGPGAGGVTGGGGSKGAVSSSAKSSSSANNNSGKVSGAEETFALFTFQTEWWTYTISTLGTLLVFFDGTASENEDPRNWILGVFSLILVCVLVTAHARDSVVICCSPFMENDMLSRLIMQCIILILVCASWPIGTFLTAPVLTCIIIQAYAMKNGIGNPPAAVTDNFVTECEWVCLNPACSAGRMVSAFIFFVINIFAGIWGYIEGEQRAKDLQDEVEAWDIRENVYGAQTMFGRMFTVNLFIVTLISLRVCCVSNAEGIMGMMCAPWANPDLRKNLHRVGGYFMVFSMLWHLFFAFYSYILSGSTKDYFEVFGYPTIITGGGLLFLMGLIISSSNNAFYSMAKNTWKWLHAFGAWLLLALLFFHGEGGINTLYWYLGLLPALLYTADVALRLIRSLSASPQDEF